MGLFCFCCCCCCCIGGLALLYIRVLLAHTLVGSHSESNYNSCPFNDYSRSANAGRESLLKGGGLRRGYRRRPYIHRGCEETTEWEISECIACACCISKTRSIQLLRKLPSRSWVKASQRSVDNTYEKIKVLLVKLKRMKTLHLPQV